MNIKNGILTLSDFRPESIEAPEDYGIVADPLIWAFVKDKSSTVELLDGFCLLDMKNIKTGTITQVLGLDIELPKEITGAYVGYFSVPFKLTTVPYEDKKILGLIRVLK